MSAFHESRDSAHSTTSQLIFGLLFGNLLAVLGVLGFRPFPGLHGLGAQASLVLAVGVLSLVASGLLFLASALRRSATSWWIVAVALNVTQIGRLIVAVAAIAAWAEMGEITGLFWAFLFVPLLVLLSAVGVVMTLREARKARRRRLSHAA
jgi:hypothetical protein